MSPEPPVPKLRLILWLLQPVGVTALLPLSVMLPTDNSVQLIQSNKPQIAAQQLSSLTCALDLTINNQVVQKCFQLFGRLCAFAKGL